MQASQIEILLSKNLNVQLHILPFIGVILWSNNEHDKQLVFDIPSHVRQE